MGKELGNGHHHIEHHIAKDGKQASRDSDSLERANEVQQCQLMSLDQLFDVRHTQAELADPKADVLE